MVGLIRHELFQFLEFIIKLYSEKHLNLMHFKCKYA